MMNSVLGHIAAPHIGLAWVTASCGDDRMPRDAEALADLVAHELERVGIGAAREPDVHELPAELEPTGNDRDVGVAGDRFQTGLLGLHIREGHVAARADPHDRLEAHAELRMELLSRADELVVLGANDREAQLSELGPNVVER